MIQMESPFKTIYEGQFTTGWDRNLLQAITILADDLSENARDVFISESIKSDHIPGEVAVKRSTIEEALKKYIKQDEIECPPGIPKAAFDELDLRQKTTIYFHRMLEIPSQITAPMRRVLLREPWWVGYLINKFPRLLLTPKHYTRLGAVIENLKAVSNEEDEATQESISLMSFMHPELYEAMFGLITRGKQNNDETAPCPDEHFGADRGSNVESEWRRDNQSPQGSEGHVGGARF